MLITIYTISDCPFCKKEKEYFDSLNLPFVEKNLEHSREYLEEMMVLSNKFAGVPFTIINKDDGATVKIKGFTKEEFDQVLGLIPAVPAGNSTPLPPTPPEPSAPTVPTADEPIEEPILPQDVPTSPPPPVGEPAPEPVLQTPPSATPPPASLQAALNLSNPIPPADVPAPTPPAPNPPVSEPASEPTPSTPPTESDPNPSDGPANPPKDDAALKTVLSSLEKLTKEVQNADISSPAVAASVAATTNQNSDLPAIPDFK